MTTAREKYNQIMEELNKGIELGEQMLQSLSSVLEQRKKQLDIGLKAAEEAHARLELIVLQTGIESVDTYKQAAIVEGYLKTLSTNLRNFHEAFADKYNYANINGLLKEKLSLYRDHADSPEYVVEANSSVPSPGAMLLSKPKKQFGDN